MDFNISESSYKIRPQKRGVLCIVSLSHRFLTFTKATAASTATSAWEPLAASGINVIYSGPAHEDYILET